MKIAFTGGGTAGHIMPNFAVWEELIKDDWQGIYVGSNGMEKELVAKNTNLSFFEITCAKLERKLTLKNLLIPFKVFKGISQAKKILKKEKPDVVFSKGGFVAVPVVIACKHLKIPVISHESDLSVGLANKINVRYSKKLCTTFESTAKLYKNGVHTGAPLRKQLFSGDEKIALSIAKFQNPAKPTVLIFGGSLGAVAINDVVKKTIIQLEKKFNIIHIVGKNNFDKTIKNSSYFQTEFAFDIQNYFAASDVVVSRAGSNAIFELLALKKPMLLIPLPKGASRGDQVENAKEFEKKHFAKVLYQDEITPEIFLQNIENLFINKRSNITHMQKANANGTLNIVKIIKNAALKKL